MCSSDLVPVNNVTQLVDYAKRNPGKLNCGSFGIGSVAHIYCELIKIQTGAEWLHVPFKGAAALVTDLSVGRVEVSFLSVGSVVQHWKAGKVKVLALNDPARYKTLPDLPAITEEMPKLELLGNWMGLLAPANLPPAGSGPVIYLLAPCFQAQGNISTVEPQTYLYYIQLRPSQPSQNIWVPYNEATEDVMRDDFKQIGRAHV